MRALVTGGAGFIGSHLVDWLVREGWDVVVVDRLDRGKKNIQHHLDTGAVELHVFDIGDLERLRSLMEGVDTVFHMAANADIRGGVKNTRVDLEENVIKTWNVLEAMRLQDVGEIVFASSAALYGDAAVIPTPEDYFPIQTSFYGASKLAGEGYIEAFSEAFGIKAWMYRFVSVVGERHPHGVTYDFVHKLRRNPRRLEILGNGKQKKSFLYVGDCVGGIMHGYRYGKDRVNIFNLGNEEYTTVDRVAEIVVEEMGLKDVEFVYTGGDRGWVGDAPMVFLSIEKMKKLGWKPEVGVEEAIRKTARWLIDNPGWYENP